MDQATVSSLAATQASSRSRLRLVPPLESNSRDAENVTGPVFSQTVLANLKKSEVLADIRDFWRALCAGESTILCLMDLEQHTVVCLVDRPPSDAPKYALAGRRRHVVEAVLTGKSLKSVAADLDVSMSTVSAAYKDGVEALGVSGAVTRVPVALVQLWYVYRRKVPLLARSWRSEHRTQPFVAVELPRPDTRLDTMLSPGELNVCRLLLDGHSHTQIALARGRSPRTIANQLSSTFRRLGVSGRLDLVTELVRTYHEPSDTRQNSFGSIGVGPRRRPPIRSYPSE